MKKTRWSQIVIVIVIVLLSLPLLINLCYCWESNCTILHSPSAWATFWATYLFVYYDLFYMEDFKGDAKTME